jgi:hypothetical protein
MVYWLLVLQLVVPTALLLALAVARVPSRAAWSAGFAATTAVLVLLALTGLWIVPPAWTLMLYCSVSLLPVGRAPVVDPGDASPLSW